MNDIEANADSPVAAIRSYRPADLEALYQISLLTGDAGRDATALYQDPKLLGHIYSAPYATLEPDGVFVLEDRDGVGGYILGAIDTTAFETRLEQDWWRRLRQAYPPAPPGQPPASWTADEQRRHRIHRPRSTPEAVTTPYPSHLHINLLPRLQRRGHGRRMLDRWLAYAREAGSPGAHLGVSVANAPAHRFYLAYGWRAIEPTPRSAAEPMWMGFRL